MSARNSHFFGQLSHIHAGLLMFVLKRKSGRQLPRSRRKFLQAYDTRTVTVDQAKRGFRQPEGRATEGLLTAVGDNPNIFNTSLTNLVDHNNCIAILCASIDFEVDLPL